MKRTTFILIGILLLALILRTAHLAVNPPATYGDEISFAWNAWSILKTGADEWGVRLPIQFRAFDDYKSAIPVYLLVPLFAVFGMSTFILRLPVALFGVGTVWLLYLLVKELDAKRGGLLPLLSAFLLAVTPWHVHLSRGYFESTIALFFCIAGVYFFVRAKEKNTYLYASAVFFVLTLYTYLTPRMMFLLFIPLLFLWARKWIFRSRKQLSIFFLILLIGSIPLVKVSFFNKGLSRIDKLTQTRNQQLEKKVVDTRNSVQSPIWLQKLLHNKPVYWAQTVVNDYVEHFSANFLYLFGDSSLRYGLGSMGMLYLIELPFLLVGIYATYSQNRSLFFLFTVWALTAPIPAALVGKPFAVRSLPLVIPLVTFSAYGVVYVLEHIQIAVLKKLSVVLLVMMYGMSIGYYVVRYHLEYKTYAATWWGWENKAAIDLALKEQDKYDQIFISNFYSGAELAYAYYTQMDPVAYRQAKNNPVVIADDRHQIKFGKIYIGSLDIDAKRKNDGVIPPKTLYIGRPEEVDSAETISAPNDGRILFKIYRTN